MARTKQSSLSAGAVKAVDRALKGMRAASFLSFLASDIKRSPHRIRPLDASLATRMEQLTQGMTVDPNEDLGDNPLI